MRFWGLDGEISLAEIIELARKSIQLGELLFTSQSHKTQEIKIEASYTNYLHIGNFCLNHTATIGITSLS
jgi:hypothetical protein